MVNEAIIMDGIIQGEKGREGEGRGQKGAKKAEVTHLWGWLTERPLLRSPSERPDEAKHQPAATW